MIERLLPARVRYAEAWQDDFDVRLFPEEEEQMGATVAARRNEYATVRGCARRALAELGYPASPLLKGERGAPAWPQHIVGSMTHCAGYRAAAVALEADFVTVGIDAEPNEPLPEGVLDIVARPEERACLESRGASDAFSWGRLLFSAKESLYKAWFPVTRRWLNFEDVRITFDYDGDGFEADVLVWASSGAGELCRQVRGRWMVSDGLLATAVTVPRQPPGRALHVASDDRPSGGPSSTAGDGDLRALGRRSRRRCDDADELGSPDDDLLRHRAGQRALHVRVGQGQRLELALRNGLRHL